MQIYFKVCYKNLVSLLCSVTIQIYSTGLDHSEFKLVSSQAEWDNAPQEEEPNLGQKWHIKILELSAKSWNAASNCLYDHVNNLITPLQHGFLRNRSCVTQLLSVLHTIDRNLDKNVQTDVIYLDFAKAFDTVDHYVLLSTLKAYGVSGQLLTWFANYLSGRLQRVVIDGATSQWAPGPCHFWGPSRQPFGATTIHNFY